MLELCPSFTGCTGVPYSTGYNFRCSSMAFATRSSSSTPTVLIHAIRSLLTSPRVVPTERSPRRSSAARWTCLAPFHLRPSRWRRLRLYYAQRHRYMFMNRLPLVIVLRMRLPVRSGNRLRPFIRLEPQIAVFVLIRPRLVAQPAVAKHQVVVRLQILRINLQRLFKLADRLPI